MQSDCRQLADQFSTLGDRARTQAEGEAKGFAEGAHLFLDLLKAYQVRERERERERELGTNGDYILIMVYF